ncbi:MAG: DUF2309 family protein [Candidatus Hydrogenedens sp.]|nr:DUF2309 family protein [Candidatus Hydrogenedens sp.]
MASNVVAPVWPLETSIAVNPLQGLEDLPFEDALREARRQHALCGYADRGRQAVNREWIKWCAAYFDAGQATIAMPGRDRGFYRSFAELARFDARLTGSETASALLASLPDSPEDAIARCLREIGIREAQQVEFIRQTIASLPGWAGYVKWKEQWQAPDARAARPASLVEFAAVGLVLTVLLWPGARILGFHRNAAPTVIDDLAAREARFRKSLLEKLGPQADVLRTKQTVRSDAQLVFCIDVRSEPFRRAIEAQGNYETLGFAGFFGLPVRVQGIDDDHALDSCPVLIQPSHEVRDEASDCDRACLGRHERGRSLLRMRGELYQWLKYNFATPFALVEMLGPWLGLRMIAQTLASSFVSRLSADARSAVMPAVDAKPVLDGIELERRAAYGEAALRMMGLTENFAPLVVFCGHGSSSTNNAYASALDCGACGGRHGGPNARILAEILNTPQVRAVLDDNGLTIPDDTLFLGAEHDTTQDLVALYPSQGQPPMQQSRLEKLRADLTRAQVANAIARTATFGQGGLDGDAALRELARRSSDWAEVRPEWGLARNAAFIIGPNDLTRNVRLEGRCFLHSYDWKADPAGAYLTTILTAPMVVAQWINSQYLFSTLDNVAYGGGSKATQNITGKFGAMQGNASDLMHGLPLQSVFEADGKPYHEPMRLLTVVYAPCAMVDAVICAEEVLKKLFGNGWVTLVCIDPTSNQAHLLRRDLTWAPA